MLFGMGTVFVFLTVLVLATTLMSALVARFAPPLPEARDTAVEPRIAAVIAAAIREHRRRA